MSEQAVVGSGGGGEGRHRSDLVRVFAGAGVVVSLYLLSRSNYLFFHSIIEVFSIVIAFGVFMVAWNTRRWVANDYLLFLGISFLFVGGIDFLHTLAYPGMGILPGSSTNLASQLWILARCLQGVSLLAAPLFLSRRVRLVPAFSFYALVAVLGVASIRYWGVFPDTFIEGQGLTTFKIASEYIICGILTGALVFLYRRKAAFERTAFRMLSAAIVVTIASEIAFTLYGHAYGFPNMAGHLLKVVAFYLVYQAVIATNLSSPYAFLFRSVEESHVNTQHERDRAQSYLHVAGSMLLVLDADGRVELINRRGCEVVGYPEDEILGKPWFESFLPSRIRKDVRVLFDTLMAGEVEPFEYAESPVITSSGEERLIAWHNSVLRENGKIVGTISSGEDVTERTKAEEETRLLAAFPAENPNPVLRADEEGVIEFANEASAPVLQTWGVGVGDRLPAEWQSRSKAARGAGSEQRAELTCGGRVFEITVAPLKERGEVNLYGLDVTERRKAEQRLRDSEEKFRSLFEQSMDAIYVCSPGGDNIEANQAWLDLLGYTRDELSHLTVLDAYADPDDREGFVQRMAETGLVEDEVRFKKKDGTVMDCQRTAVARKDEQGNTVAFLGVVRDVTEGKRAQQALQDSEEKYRSLFKQSREAICLVEPGGRVLDVNRAWLDLFGYSADELPGLNAADLYANPEEREDFLRRMAETGLVEEEMRFVKKDGTVMDCVGTSVAQKDEHGNTVAFQSVVSDITERKKAEEEIRLLAAFPAENPNPVLRASEEGVIVFANEASAPVLQTWGVGVGDRLPAEWLSRSKAARDDGAALRAELECGERVFEITVAPLGERGEVNLYALDVTERRKAEEETRLLAAFPAENPNPVLRVGEDGVIVFANEASAPVLRTWGVGVGDRLPAEWLSHSKAARDDGAALRAELECGKRVFEITVAPLEERGEVNLYALDVTERRRAEGAVRESEGKYHSLFESSKEAIVLTAPDGRVVDANPAFLELFGYTQDDLAALRMPDLVADGPDRDEFVARLHRDGQILDEECRFRKKDGTVMDCIRTIVVWRNEAGEVMAHQGLVRDVTQSKRDQAELQRSREELRALAVHLQLVREEERSAVAWELHDEVGQALAVLKMDIDSFRRQIPPRTLAAVQPRMEAMKSLLDDTIDRLRNLYSDLRPGMLDDLGLAATVEWQTSEFERRSGIKCRVVKADPVQLREADCALALYRAFQEALDNIVRNSGATEFEVELKQHDGRVTLRVSDNGRGITEDELTSPSALGLAGMRERVLACGGELVVSRGDDGGTIVEASAIAALPGKDGDTV